MQSNMQGQITMMGMNHDTINFQHSIIAENAENKGSKWGLKGGYQPLL